jgi:hypothetical protein
VSRTGPTDIATSKVPAFKSSVKDLSRKKNKIK